MKILVFIFFLGLVNHTWADTTYKCEDSMTVHYKVQNAPKDWKTWDVNAEGKNNSKKFSSIEIFQGHPSKKNKLAADISETNLKWNFAGFGDKQKEPVWLSCKYEDTAVILLQRLPLTTTSCSSQTNSSSVNCK